MTREQAGDILTNIALNEVIPAAEAVAMMREWQAGGVIASTVIDVLKQLRPTEVLEIKAVAERKLARRNRPRRKAG